MIPNKRFSFTGLVMGKEVAISPCLSMICKIFLCICLASLTMKLMFCFLQIQRLRCFLIPDIIKVFTCKKSLHLSDNTMFHLLHFVAQSLHFLANILHVNFQQQQIHKIMYILWTMNKVACVDNSQLFYINIALSSFKYNSNI